ncbi:hypothetical protein BV22DRAFT_974760, partial [Leucogyrophana mollusca]
EPWQPFSCRADFEFAEIAQKARLNREQTNELLKLISRIAAGHAKLSFETYADVRKAWDHAACQMTPFNKHVIRVPYKKEHCEFDVHTRPLLEWALDLLQNPLLAPHFVWDAQRLYKHNGTQFEHFIHEPWTADRWWDIQSRLENRGVPLCFILYADKTHLLSSGTVKGYPVVVRCANLLVDIGNGDGGGGHVVGWLPVVPEDAIEDGKLTYTNFKRVVWHEAFHKLLESIIPLSKTGFPHTCYDDVVRWLFPLILILSADYEEQCVMALIRGLHGKCPCPICLVPAHHQYKHSKTYPLRTAEEAQALVAFYKQDRAAGEERLKEQGLRPVENVFWQVANSDPHQALSFDQLHVYHIGLFGHHLFVEFKRLAKEQGRDAEKKIDDAFAAFPRWRNLNHFERVDNISFSDGNKLRDISKQILYAAHNIFDRKKEPAGYRLLRCIASYIQLDMYISMDVHTESTLAAGEAELLVFEMCLDEYIEVLGDDDSKSWCFIKNHLSKHGFQDVRLKGVSRGYSTRPNEKQHEPLKKAYVIQTNGKEIAVQILRIDHDRLVCELIRSRIDTLDEERRRSVLANQELEEEDLDDRPFDGYLHLGAPQSVVSLQKLEETHHTDRAFEGFRKKLVTFLNQYLLAYGFPLATWLTLMAHDTIQEHRYLKLHYESTVDWKQ